MALPDYVQRRKGTYDNDALLTDQEDQVIIATGNSTAGLRVGKGAKFDINALFSAVSGTTPTLDIVIEGSDTGVFGGEEEAVMAFPQQTAVGEQQLAFESEHEYIRAAWTAGGTTPSFTTTISLRN